MKAEGGLRRLGYSLLLVILVMPVFVFVYEAGLSAPMRMIIVFVVAMIAYSVLQRFGKPTS